MAEFGIAKVPFHVIFQMTHRRVLYLAISLNPVYLRWVEKIFTLDLENWKLFSLFFLSYTLPCKWSELELEITGRMTS